MRAFAAGQRRRKSQTSARDALVLKARVIVLAEVLPISPRCIHLKGQSALRRRRHQSLTAGRCNPCPTG